IKPDRVWHLAANSDISFGTTYTDFDLQGGTLVTYNVLEAMRLAGTTEIVFASSGAIYGEPSVMPTPENYGPLFPISMYAASKIACETMITAFCHNYAMRTWIFRFGNIVGPFPTHGVIYDFIRKLMADPTRLTMLGDGQQSKPYVHVEDCLDGMMFGQEHAREDVNCYNLAVPDQTSVNQFAAVGSARRKSSSSVAPLRAPLSESVSPSALKSSRSHVRPSERGVVPSAQRYGPQAIHGAMPFS